VTGSATVRVGSLTAVYWVGDPGQQPHWNIGSNWSSGVVPTASDDVVIDLPGTYEIDIINSPAVAKSVTIGAATGQQTLMLWSQNLTVSGALTMGPTAQLYTIGATLTAQLENQGYWYVDESSVLSGTGFAHVNTGTIDTYGDFTINLDGSTFSNQAAFVATGGQTNIVQTGTSPSFTLSGAMSSLTIGSGRTFTVDGGTFNYEAGSIDGRFGTGELALVNGAVGNFTPDFFTSNVVLSLTDATLNGPGTLTSDNIDIRTYVTNSTISNNVVNSETIYVNGTATFTGTSFNNTANGHIYGIGTLDITGTSFTNAGRIDPAAHFATDPNPDTLTIAGNLTQSATTEIQVHIMQVAPGNVINDVVAVTGTASLNGALMAVVHPNDTGYIPTTGDEFEVLTSASRVGSFANSNWDLYYDSNGDGTIDETDAYVTLNIEYRGTSVWLVVP
jgi:fibronectin-binding autotransporter adhesin